MTFPINLHFGDLEISSHLIFELLSFTLGYQYYAFLKRKNTDLISDENRFWIFIGAVSGAWLGSHLLGILENPDYFAKTNYLNRVKPQAPFFVYLLGNKTVVGGLLGGLIGVEVTKKIIGVTTSSGDLMTFPLILGLIIGRIGCFLAGVHDGTFGVATNVPWAMDLGDGVLRHPTNLYEIVFLLLLWLFIILLEKRIILANGYRFKVFMVSYLLFRLSVEFIKPAYFFSFGLSSIQLACLAGILYYCVLAIKSWRYPFFT
ncbi:MAG: prolipoprotein diacylglyceryl transferase [Verrucomicrobia bacterium]|nr:prolipoprotein diacylglyceryl transferase [Cytophagales bacterium]